MRAASTIIIASLLIGCSSVPADAPQRSAAQQAKFMKLTNGLAAGPAMNCVPSWRTQDLAIIDGRTVGFSQTRSNVVMVNLTDGCQLLGSGAFAMQTNTSGMGLCTGDIVQVVDTMNKGMSVGSCAVASIVPYSKP